MVMSIDASHDPQTGQVYVPPRTFVADGSMRRAEPISVPACGVLYSQTSYQQESYGIVDLDCGARIQALLAPGTGPIGCRVVSRPSPAGGPLRFEHE